MELINQTKTLFKIGKDKEGKDITFRINEVKDIEESMARTLLTYEGINSVESLKTVAEETFNKAKKSLKK